MWNLKEFSLLVLCALQLAQGQSYSCGPEPTGSSGYIKTPNYPHNYPTNSGCTWKLTAPQNHIQGPISYCNSECCDDFCERIQRNVFIGSNPLYKKIKLEFLDFHLENEVLFFSCHDQDYLDVYNGESELFGTYCGSTTPDPILSTGKSMKLVFYSDWSDTRTGFRIQWQVDPPPYTCGSTSLTSSLGYIESPNYPSNYPDNAFCTWRVTALTDQVVRVTFIAMNLEGTDSSCHDDVELFDGESQSFGQFCGTAIPSPIESSGSLMKIVFSSDTSVSRSGFRLKYEAVAPSYTCGSTSLTSSLGYIESPNYPNNYPNNADCTWRVTASTGQVVRITLLVMNLEESGNSCHDSVEFFNDEAQSLGQFCGTTPPSDVESSGRLMKIVFLSDSSVSRSGFRLKYESVAPPYTCGSTLLTSSLGYIESPNYPINYPNNADCTWRVTASSGHVVHITFLEMDLEEASGNTCHDYVELFDGETQSLQHFCGRNLPSDVVSSGRLMKIVFSSNSSYSRSGFRLKYESIAPSYTCGATSLTSSLGYIESPNYPSNYPNNAYCTWRVTASSGHAVRITFLAIDLDEQSGSSCYDYVELFDGDTQSLQQFCGRNLPGDVVSSGSLMKIVFSSDPSYSRSGFRLKYQSIGGGGGSGSVRFARESLLVSILLLYTLIK